MAQGRALCLRLALLGALLHLGTPARQPDWDEGLRTSSSKPAGPRAETLPTTMKELVEGAGFPLEEHFVTTDDGYVLGLFRIPYGRGQARKKKERGQRRYADPRPPVLLLHGLLDSSAAWVLNSPSESLGFLLADAGYDVFLGNSRGNAFSRNHTGVQPSSAAFWDFTFDDMADYDVPAMVAHVLAETGAERVAYVGHSQGTTQAIAALASNADLRSRVSIAVMLAPAVFMAHMSSYPMLALAELQADQLFNLLGVTEFMPPRHAAADLFGGVCKATPLLCVSVITAICGFDARNVNASRLPEYVQYAPSGTSVKNMAHWAQAVRRSRQRAEAGQAPQLDRYDYSNTCWTPRGLPHTCNMRVYGSLEPPAYNLSALGGGPPLAIFYGARDKLADLADVQALLAALPAGSVAYHQEEATYEHLDFTWGTHAKDAIYPAVLLLLRQHFEQQAPGAAA